MSNFASLLKKFDLLRSRLATMYFLILYIIGGAFGLASFATWRFIIHHITFRYVRWTLTICVLLFFWFLVVIVTILAPAAFGRVYLTQHAGISGAFYWISAVSLIFRSARHAKRFDRFQRNTLKREPQFIGTAAAHQPLGGLEHPLGITTLCQDGDPPNGTEHFLRNSAARGFLLLFVGIVLGFFSARLLPASQKDYFSFEECFLEQMKGRQLEMGPTARRYCNDRLNRSPK